LIDKLNRIRRSVRVPNHALNRATHSLLLVMPMQSLNFTVQRKRMPCLALLLYMRWRANAGSESRVISQVELHCIWQVDTAHFGIEQCDWVPALA
jgi:hypothetical protein